jgi:hypothetical protein
MTLRFVDGFDHYGSSHFGRKWSAVGTAPSILASSGRRGGGCMEATSSTRWVRFALPSSVATVVCGYAFNRNGGSDPGYIAYFGDSGADQCGLYLESDGRVSFRRGTTVIATSSATVPSTGWIYIELKATIHDTTGVYEVRFNGSATAVLSGTGANTRSTANDTANSVTFHGRPGSGTGGPSTSTLYDDIYIADTSGSLNNDFLGDVRVDAYRPNANGTSSQLTGSDGNSTDNYLLVDETTVNDDTDYVESSTAGHKDLYGFPALAYTAASILGVQINAMARKDDSGTRSLTPVTRSGSTDYDGTSQSLATSYLDYREIRETDPATSSAWTQSNLEAAEFGVKVA